MKALGDSHTAYDVMREYMIIGAELDGKYQIPMLDRYGRKCLILLQRAMTRKCWRKYI